MQTKEFKTVTYRIAGIITEQTILDDLQLTLNNYAKEGWNTISVQLLGEADFLIVLEKDV